jgi:hypothetical protein
MGKNRTKKPKKKSAGKDNKKQKKDKLERGKQGPEKTTRPTKSKPQMSDEDDDEDQSKHSDGDPDDLGESEEDISGDNVGSGTDNEGDDALFVSSLKSVLASSSVPTPTSSATKDRQSLLDGGLNKKKGSMVVKVMNLKGKILFPSIPPSRPGWVGQENGRCDFRGENEKGTKNGRLKM